MEEESTFPISEEATYPSDNIPMYPFGSQCSGELGTVDIVKAALDIKEEGGDPEVKWLEEADLMGESSGGIECGKTGEGAGLVGVEEAAVSGNEGEAGGGNTFNNLGESF